MERERVDLEEIADSALRILIRMDLGIFSFSGPRNNILTVESLVAFSTVVHQLYQEGYLMVPPEQYAAEYGIEAAAVEAELKGEGSLFAVSYPDSDPPSLAVSLRERETSELGPHLE